jgi:hypothetical protein
MKKEKVLATVAELPNEFELDVLLEKLVFMEKVEKGLNQIEEGKVKTQQEVKDLVQQWRK